MSSPKHRVAGLLAAAAIAIGACGSAPATPAPTRTPTPTPTPSPVVTPAPIPTPTPAPTQVIVGSISADQLVAVGRLTVCSDLTDSPQEFKDLLNRPTGSDIEITAEIATRLGLELAVQNVPLATIFTALSARQCDIIVSGQLMTAANLAKVDMIPYFAPGQSFIVAKDATAVVDSIYDLCNQPVGVKLGSKEAAHLVGAPPYARVHGLAARCQASRQNPPALKTFTTDYDAITAVVAHKIAAYFVDSPAAGYYAKEQSYQLALVPNLTLEIVPEGIGVAKNRGVFYAAVRNALQSMIVDGTYLAILKNYGVESGALTSTSR